MATIGPKEAQLRAMREQQYAERHARRKPVPKREKLAGANAAVKRIETLKLTNETLSVDEPGNETLKCLSCGKAFHPKRSTARYCSSACRLKAHRGK
jgi:hypothetical protein